MEDGVLSAWVGRPVGKSEIPAEREKDEISTLRSGSEDDQASLTDSAGSIGADDDLQSDGSTAHVPRKETSRIHSLADFARLQQGFFIEPPKLSEEEKEDYDFLPGHFSVERIISKIRHDKYMVKLKSGERDLVSVISLLLHCYFIASRGHLFTFSSLHVAFSFSSILLFPPHFCLYTEKWVLPRSPHASYALLRKAPRCWQSLMNKTHRSESNEAHTSPRTMG